MHDKLEQYYNNVEISIMNKMSIENSNIRESERNSVCNKMKKIKQTTTLFSLLNFHMKI